MVQKKLSIWLFLVLLSVPHSGVDIWPRMEYYSSPILRPAVGCSLWHSSHHPSAGYTGFEVCCLPVENVATVCEYGDMHIQEVGDLRPSAWTQGCGCTRSRHWLKGIPCSQVTYCHSNHFCSSEAWWFPHVRGEAEAPIPTCPGTPLDKHPYSWQGPG